MLGLKNQDHYKDDFLKIINNKNINSIIKKEYNNINNYIFRGYYEYDKCRIIANTIVFIDKLKNEIKNKNLGKRKRSIKNDVKKIRCYCCNKDITKLYNNGNLLSHTCFINYNF